MWEYLNVILVFVLAVAAIIWEHIPEEPPKTMWAKGLRCYYSSLGTGLDVEKRRLHETSKVI